MSYLMAFWQKFTGEREIVKKPGKYTGVLQERNPDDPQIQLAICDFLISEKDYGELLVLLNTVVMNSSIKKEDKISLFARLIDIADLIQKHIG